MEASRIQKPSVLMAFMCVINSVGHVTLKKVISYSY